MDASLPAQLASRPFDAEEFASTRAPQVLAGAEAALSGLMQPEVYLTVQRVLTQLITQLVTQVAGGAATLPGSAVTPTIRVENRPIEPLTRREREVLERVAAGASNKVIA